MLISLFPLLQFKITRHRVAGFTLIELAIGLFIITLLIGSILGPLSAQVEQRQISETQKSLEQINEALIGFSLANGRLPCPADPTIADGQPDAGVERASCDSGSEMQGVLPWTTLGIRGEDSWGRRYSYRVTTIYADPIAANTFTPPISCAPSPVPTQSSFALCSVGNITITDGGSNVATNIPAVTVSHGKNGFGAYTRAGIQ
jgi:type II secretory pathway pseudopilin PulG